MANPLIYGGQQPNAATAPQAGVNTNSPAVLKNRNNFYEPYQYLNTERFADITPFLVQEVGFNEDFDYTRNTDLRAPTFSSPIMSQLTKHAHYIAVPKSVIYPRLWELMTVIPKKGQDIDFQQCRAGIVSTNLASAFSFFHSQLPDIGDLSSYDAKSFLKCLVFVYVSAGANSLPALLGCPLFRSRVLYDGDVFPVVEALLSEIKSKFSSFGIRVQMKNGAGKAFLLVNNGNTVAHGIDDLVDYYLRVDVDDINIVRFYNTKFVDGTTSVSVPDLLGALLQPVYYRESVSGDDDAVPATFVNIENIIAYQLGCAQFFTSDDVDYIYTAHLWYQNFESLCLGILNPLGQSTFSILKDGIRYQVDPYCAVNLAQLLQVVVDNPDKGSDVLDIFIELFAIRKSLRYGDMFNSARLRPLAVGDYSAPVVANAVSAVDMTNATLMQRLLNNVNAVRNTITSFIKTLYGIIPDDVPMQPLYVAHSSDVLAGSIVSNNSNDEQGKLVTNIALHSQHREFNLHFNQDAILLGLTTYDCLQCYVEPLSPFALKVDRFDYFNPMLQNIGDQPVPNSILIGSVARITNEFLGVPFGYLQNDFEYKQSINQAHGAFADGFIPSWALLRDIEDELGSAAGTLTSAPVVNSSFIRQSNREFNQFYSSLIGAGTQYYHFIVSYVHDLSITRPMEFVSGVLFTNSR